MWRGGVCDNTTASLNPFEHGWVETDAGVIDGTRTMRASKDPMAESAERRISIPFYRHLTCPHEEGDRNPKYDAGEAIKHALAKQKADAYCLENTPRP